METVTLWRPKMGIPAPPDRPWYRNGWNWFAITVLIGVASQFGLVWYIGKSIQLKDVERRGAISSVR